MSLCLTACAGAPDEGWSPEETEVSQAALNGQVTIGASCSANLRDKIREAMSEVTSSVHAPRFVECLKVSQTTMHEGALPETIAERMRENMPTQIECSDTECEAGAAGCAYLDLPYEKLFLTSVGLALPVGGLRNTIAHEIAHNKGWEHMRAGHTDYRYTVPQVVNYCSSGGIGFDPITEFVNETELHFIGGEGGSPFELSCAGNTFVTGMTADSSSYVNRLGLACDGQLQTARAGSYYDSTATASLGCSPSSVVTGIWGRSSAFVDQLGFSCASKAVLAAGDVPDESQIYLAGGAGGTIVERHCPPGMAVKRVYGRAGARIDQLRVVCQNVNEPARGASHDLPLAGSAIGVSLRNQCLGFGMVTSLFGRAGGALDRLGARCRPTALDAAGYPVFSDSSQHLVEAIGGTGGDQGTEHAPNDFGFNDLCPTNQGMIGLRLRSDGGIRRIEGICVPPASWSSPFGAVTRSYTSVRGGSAGTSETRECPRGEFLVGLETWSKKTVHATPTVQGIRPICRRLGT